MKQVEYYKNGNRTLRIKYEGIKKLLEKKDKEIERLNKENKILRENAEHNDKVVDKVNWGNKRLNNIINELENYIRARADDNDTCSVCSVMADDLLNILKGSDKK